MWKRCYAAAIKKISGRLVAVMAGLAVGSPAMGGAGGSIVFDPTNYTENAMTAMQTVKNVEENMRQRYYQYRSLLQQYRNAKQSIQGVNDFDSLYRATSNTHYLFTQMNHLQRDIGMAHESVMETYRSYTVSDKSATQFIRDQLTGARNNASESGTTLESARENLKAVEKRWGEIKDWQRKNASTTGHQAALDNLNGQMNNLLKQQNQLLEMTSHQQIARGRDQLEEAKRRKRDAKRQEQAWKAHEENAEYTDQVLEQWRNAGDG